MQGWAAARRQLSSLRSLAAGGQAGAQARRQAVRRPLYLPTLTPPTEDLRLKPDVRLTVEFGSHSSVRDGSARWVAGAGGASSFDVQQRFKVARGLSLEVRWGRVGGFWRWRRSAPGVFDRRPRAYHCLSSVRVGGRLHLLGPRGGSRGWLGWLGWLAWGQP